MPHATFEDFFEAEKDRLLRVLCVVTGSRAEAEDIAQESFTRVLERWDRVAAMREPVAYLHRTAINEFRSRARRAKVAVRRVLMAADERDVFEVIDDRDAAMRALARLTPRQRVALVLTEFWGYSGEEAGKLLGIKASTVWVLIHQARRALGDAEASDA